MSALRERHIFFQTLHRITDLMVGDRDLNRIRATILDCAIQVLGGEAAVLICRDDSGMRRFIRRRTQIMQGSALEELPLPDAGLVAAALRSGRPVAVGPASIHPEFDPTHDSLPGVRTRNLVVVPFVGRADNIGALAVFNSLRFDGSLDEEMDILAVLGNQTAVAEENFRLYKRLEQLAITDELTQVFNYRFLKTALRKEVKRATRFRLEFSVLMIDVDNLKSYNEVNGHLGGSGLLRTIGGLLTSNSRDVDLVAKYGGDEFMMILPQTGGEGAEVVADRVRQAVEAHTFVNARRGAITVSIGVATFPHNGQSVEQLVSSADASLYEAKRGGRNRICVARRAA